MPNKPETIIPRQNQLPVVGKLLEKVKQLDFENDRKIDDFDTYQRSERTEEEN